MLREREQFSPYVVERTRFNGHRQLTQTRILPFPLCEEQLQTCESVCVFWQIELRPHSGQVTAAIPQRLPERPFGLPNSLPGFPARLQRPHRPAQLRELFVE